MTINEYKQRFLEIFKEMEKEHGRIKSVEMEHGEEIYDPYGRFIESRNKCTITF